MKFFRLLITMFFTAGTLLAAQPAYKGEVGAAQLKYFLENGAKVVDIRTPGEWAQTGVIKGSRMITFFDEKGGYNINAFMAAFSKAVPDKKSPVVIICRTGSRSVPVADLLARMGYENVYNETRGIMEWAQMGFPLERP